MTDKRRAVTARLLPAIRREKRFQQFSILTSGYILNTKRVTELILHIVPSSRELSAHGHHHILMEPRQNEVDAIGYNIL
jgi:hypothetical protein